MLRLSQLVLIGVLSYGPATAATIFDNGAPDNSGGNNVTDLLQANDFILSANYDVNGFRFWSMEAPSTYRGSIYYAIHQDSTGEPGSVIVSGSATPTRTADGVALGLNKFIHDVSFSSTFLSAGTYWLVIHNGTLAENSFADFYWATTSPGSGTTSLEQSLNPPSSTWDPNLAEHAFLITGTLNTGSPIPEPSTYAMMASVLLLGAAKGMRRRSRGGRIRGAEQLNEISTFGAGGIGRVRGFSCPAIPDNGDAPGSNGPVG